MPIYEYQCISCGEKFEVRQSIGEDGSKLNCPNAMLKIRSGCFPHSSVPAQVHLSLQR
jgi:putative FmdB family regulatory protein